MRPSVAASTTVVATAPLAAVSTAAHDREWWAEEAVHVGADWSGVVAGAFGMMVTAGILEQTAPQTLSFWDAPSWHDAAVEYHPDRPNRLAVEIGAKRLARLRRLMAGDVSPERAWHEFKDRRPYFRASNDR